MTTRHEGRSEQVRRLGSVPVAGVEPQVILTRVPPRPLQLVPPPVERRPRHRLSDVDQAEFTEWAESAAPPIATVADIKAIQAAEEAVFPPSPAFRVRWGRVAAWSVPVLLAGVTVVRFVNEHRELAFWTAAFGIIYLVMRAVDRWVDAP